MRHPGTLPGSSLRLCSSPACTNGDLANGSAHHHYSNSNHHHHQSLRRGGSRSTRTSPQNNASTPNSPSPPPPPPPRYPAQYPTLPMNGSACHHYRYGSERESGGTLGGRERSRERSSRRMEQLSASSHQQRQEELEIHRGSLARRDIGDYHA